MKVCSIDECEKPAISRTWCTMHYARWRSSGDPERVAYEIQKRPADGLCTLEGCDRPYFVSGVCEGHYSRRRRKGDGAEITPLEDRFYDPEEGFKGRTEPQGDCVVWTGWTDQLGYGRLKSGGKHVAAHRYSWERVNGPIPEGMFIDHICHNPTCVKVSHLRIATHAQNTRNLSGPTANNKHSGVRNVGKMGDKWRVRITKDGVVHALGCYDTIEEAEAVATEGRLRLFGEFAGKG